MKHTVTVECFTLNYIESKKTSVIVISEFKRNVDKFEAIMRFIETINKHRNSTIKHYQDANMLEIVISGTTKSDYEKIYNACMQIDRLIEMLKSSTNQGYNFNERVEFIKTKMYL